MADYISEIEEIKDYYADLLILQYRQKPRARATIKLGAELYTTQAALQINDVLDIDTAEGSQLDLIGKILGVPRNIQGFNPDKKYFSYEYTGALGFSTKDETSNGIFKTYFNSSLSVYGLSDAEYRGVLKFKAIYNIRRGSMGDLDELYFNAFGTDIKMVNNKNLSVTYLISSNISTATNAAIFLGYLQPPIGISYNYEYV